jgi:hypothetical protein
MQDDVHAPIIPRLEENSAYPSPMPLIGANHDVSREFAPDLTTESTEITESDGKERRVRTRIRNPFLPASVASVASVVK